MPHAIRQTLPLSPHLAVRQTHPDISPTLCSTLLPSHLQWLVTTAVFSATILRCNRHRRPVPPAIGPSIFNKAICPIADGSLSSSSHAHALCTFSQDEPATHHLPTFSSPAKTFRVIIVDYRSGASSSVVAYDEYHTRVAEQWRARPITEPPNTTMPIQGRKDAGGGIIFGSQGVRPH